MNYPEYFLKPSILSGKEITKTLKEYSSLIQWRDDKKDSWLDIGCGPANHTYELIIPILPSSFSKIVGADCSAKMLEYANKNYQHPKLSFRFMDIKDNNIKKYLSHENECFTHISGFFLLHLVDNQVLAMQNIYNLLEPNGDCILLTFGYLSVFDAYLEMVKNPKWTNYMFDIRKHMSYYQEKENKKEEFEKVLIAGGFTNYKIDIKDDVKDDVYSITGLDNVKNYINSINPFVDRVPIEMKEEFLCEMIDFIFPDVDKTKPNPEYILKYKLIVAYAKK